MDDLGVEIAKIALPAALALTADPIASLVDTAFIGQIVTESPDSESLVTSDKKKRIPSASSALIIGSVLGFLQAAFLIIGAKPVLGFMGIKSDSPMLHPAQQYLKLRSLGAPAVLLSLAMQGVFRGFKDTKTPLYATGDVTNIILDPIFMFVFDLGVSGAAIAHVLDFEKIDFVSPTSKHLQFGRFLKNGFLLLMRVMAVTFCVTLSASMAARQGSTTMAAFQVCLQVWLATSLLADGLAVAGQGSGYTSGQDCLQKMLVSSISLASAYRYHNSTKTKFFTDYKPILNGSIRFPYQFVAATQPINALAFVFDGVNFGASDFAYAAYSMVCKKGLQNKIKTGLKGMKVLVAMISIISLFIASSHGFVGLWIALTFYMSLRAFAGFWRKTMSPNTSFRRYQPKRAGSWSRAMD
ncbi:hypothetical protein M8C21_033490 [Ambrosia artemisiifolia]|uniref:Protein DETOXIFICATION n=1 Tax=Ambrosia artemisiifolia TaxID=4212 RepID=A0AAD5C148_AMBAR|nr:hypothetical protein M8C21_033490 [Ambrosia artemisiifolia]